MAVAILAERALQASMHGYSSYATYATADTMAGLWEIVDVLVIWNNVHKEGEEKGRQEWLRHTETEGEELYKRVETEGWDL